MMSAPKSLPPNLQMRKYFSAEICAVTSSERVFRFLASIFLVGFAFNSFETNLWCAIPAAICASFLMIGAITGWCPTALFARTPETINTGDYPDARAYVDLKR